MRIIEALPDVASSASSCRPARARTSSRASTGKCDGAKKRTKAKGGDKSASPPVLIPSSSINENDVTSGRGCRRNTTFRDLVMSYAAAYDEAGSSRKKKNAVAMLIFNHVTDYSSPPGRFLVPFDGEIARIDREESCGRLRRDHAMWKEVRFWRVMTEREALAKTMQSLRDALRTERIIQEIPDSETDPSPIPAPVSNMGPNPVIELEDRDFTCIDPLSPLTDPISDVQPIVEVVDHDLPCISIDDMDFEVDIDMDINMLDIEREIEHSQKDHLQDDACTGRHLPLSSMPLPQPLPLSPQLPTLPALRDSQRLCVRSPQILASSEADDSQIFSTAAYEGFKEADLQTVLQWIRDDAKNDYDGGGSPMATSQGCAFQFAL